MALKGSIRHTFRHKKVYLGNSSSLASDWLLRQVNVTAFFKTTKVTFRVTSFDIKAKCLKLNDSMVIVWLHKIKFSFPQADLSQWIKIIC